MILLSHTGSVEVTPSSAAVGGLTWRGFQSGFTHLADSWELREDRWLGLSLLCFSHVTGLSRFLPAWQLGPRKPLEKPLSFSAALNLWVYSLL